MQQKSRILRKISLVALLTCSCAIVEGTVIYEKSSFKPLEPFDYTSIHSITYSYSSDTKWSVDLAALISELSQGKIKVVETGSVKDDKPLNIRALMSPIMVDIEVDQIKESMVMVSIKATVSKRKENYGSDYIPLLDNHYLIEQGKNTQNEIMGIIKSNLKSFIDEYMASQEGKWQSDTFYIFG